MKDKDRLKKVAEEAELDFWVKGNVVDRELSGCPRCCCVPGQRTAQLWEDCPHCGTEPIYV